LNSVYDSRIEDFLRILCQGGMSFLRVRLKKVSEFIQRIRIHKQKGIIAIQVQKLKFHYLLPKFQTSCVTPVQHRLGMDGVGNGIAVCDAPGF
jgi:hypothetical protein